MASNAVEAPTIQRAPRWRRVLVAVARVLMIGIVTCTAGCLAVMATTSPPVIGIAMLVALVAGVIVRRRIALPAGTLALLLIITVWFVLRQPSHDRNWADDVAVLARTTIEGDTLTIDGVRNFVRFPDGQYTERWETRSYDLRRLRGVDLMVEPFAATDAVAHTMLSFDFGDDGRFILSIEARKEKGGSYGPVAGALRQYELIYTFLDERDALLVRAYAGARLYCYPARSRPDRLRRFLSTMCDAANEVQDAPQFYHIINDNCTTVWLKHLANTIQDDDIFFNPIIVLNGRIGWLLHNEGVLDTELAYDEAKERFRIDQRVLEHADHPNLSVIIRQPDGA